MVVTRRHGSQYGRKRLYATKKTDLVNDTVVREVALLDGDLGLSFDVVVGLESVLPRLGVRVVGVIGVESSVETDSGRKPTDDLVLVRLASELVEVLESARSVRLSISNGTEAVRGRLGDRRSAHVLSKNLEVFSDNDRDSDLSLLLDWVKQSEL